MESYEKKVIENLEAVLTSVIDAQDGYERAVDIIDDKEMKSYFKSKALERKEFAAEIKEELLGYKTYENIDNSGSVAGSIHRSFMGVKTALNSNESEVLLEEIIKGEKAAVKLYENVLDNKYLPQSTKIILRAQLQLIENTIAENEMEVN